MNVSCKLFIGNLSYKTTEEELKTFYEKFGAVENAYIARDKQTKKSRGYGFVTYMKASSVDDALAQRPHELDERKVEPHRACPKEYAAKPESHHTCCEIFVGNMIDTIEENDLKEHFSQYGTIVKIDIPKDKKDPTKRKNFAFVTFDDYDPVDQCCHKKFHYIKKHKLDVTKSINKKDMAQLLRKFGNGRENGYGRQSGMGRGRSQMPYGGYDLNLEGRVLEDEHLDELLINRAIARANIRMENLNFGYDDPSMRGCNDGWHERSALRNNSRGGRYLAGGRGAPKGLWM